MIKILYSYIVDLLGFILMSFLFMTIILAMLDCL
jgi:hypothetical protein